MQNNNPFLQRANNRQRKKTRKSPEKTKIKSFSQLKKLVESIKTEDASPIAVKTEEGVVNIPGAKKSMTHKLLIEGFEALKGQQMLMGLQADIDRDDEEFGGFVPAAVLKEEPVNHRLDRFIDTHFDGKREGDKVVWTLPEGKFELDPWTLTLSKS